MRRILFDFFILCVIVVAVIFAYQYFGDTVLETLFGEQQSRMYVESTPIAVTIADDPAEQKQGLSGTESLDEYEGMLFVFPQEDYYGMWMRDMLLPLDIIWIDNSARIVHIEKNVTPDTYPETFVSETPARFVLEVSAFFTENQNIVVGDIVRLPPKAIPNDLIDLID